MNDLGGPMRGLGMAHAGQGVAHEGQGCLLEGKGWPMGWQEYLVGNWGYLMKCWVRGQVSGDLSGLDISLCPKKFKNPHIPTLFEQYMLVDEIPAIIKLIKSKLSQRF